MTRVLLVTADPVGDEMGGNAIRAFELARVLAGHVAVTLGAPGELPEDAGNNIEHISWDPSDPGRLRSAIAAADFVVLPPQSARMRAWLRRTRARLVFDLYDPMPLAILEQYQDAPPLRRRLANTVALDHYGAALMDGDHFICASERQRDLWIGALLALRRITPSVYDSDRSLRSLIDVVPFGTPDDAPRGRGGALRGCFDALQEDDEIVLWNGGLHAWLDPVSAVRAMPTLLERRPRARLVFMGRPPTDPRGQAAAQAAQAEAERLGLLDRAVFFNDRWVPYRERAGWLLDADCTVCTHLDHLETRFAFRTRILDSFWAGLPVVCTTGDELAARIAQDDLGAVALPSDPDGLAYGLGRVLERGRDAYAPALRRASEDYSWREMAQPLIRLVTGPVEHPSRLRRSWRHSSQVSQTLRSFAARGAQMVRRW